jgi:hypothetical protein
MLRVSDVWERALHGPDPAVGDAIVIRSGRRSDVMTVAVVACTDPDEREGVITLALPPHLAELEAFPVTSEQHDP